MQITTYVGRGEGEGEGEATFPLRNGVSARGERPPAGKGEKKRGKEDGDEMKGRVSLHGNRRGADGPAFRPIRSSPCRPPPPPSHLGRYSRGVSFYYLIKQSATRLRRGETAGG
jgi:hypothetical protein